MEKNDNGIICPECQREHEVGAGTYVRLEGSLYIGKDRGLLNPTKEQPVLMCIPCFIKYLQRVQADLIENQRRKIKDIEGTIRTLSTSDSEEASMPVIEAPDIPEFMK